MSEQTGVLEETQEEVAAPTDDTGVEETQSEVAAQDTGETPEVSNEEKGLRETAQAERTRRQTAEDERDAALARNKILEQERQYRQPAYQPKDPFEGLEDEDLVSVRSVKEYNKNREIALNGKIDTMRVSVSTQFARQKHKDFDEVITLLDKVATPKQMAAILQDDNPAETAYLWVKSSPQYIDSLTKETVGKTVRETVDTINRHSKGVKTLSNAGAGTAKNKVTFENMSDEEFNKVVGGVVHGQKDVFKKYFGG